MKTITEDEFYDTYTILKNPFDDNAAFDGGMLETYGQEQDYAFYLSKQTNRVWTILEGDGDLYYTTGYHLINRLGYLITLQPYTEDIEVVLEN